MSKKILIINNHWNISERTKNLLKIFLKGNYNIYVLHIEKSSLINYDKKFPDRYVEEFLPLRLKRGWKILFYLPRIYGYLWRKINYFRPDIIYCNHLYLLPISLLVAKHIRAKIIYDAYEMYSVDWANYVPLGRFIVRKGIELLENWLISKVNFVLTVDSNGGFLINRYRKYNKNVVILYNVPDKEPKIDVEKLKDLKSKYRGKRILIYVGGIYEAKGSVKALEALALVKHRFSDIKLLMIGKISDSPGKLERLIKELRIEENVEFISWLPYEDMFHYLKIAHIGLALHQPVGRFLFVSKGNGRKFFTYMQASLPIIAPNFGEIGLVVKEERCGILVDTTRPKDIAKAIIYLLEHPEEAKAMGERGKKAIKEKYNWEIEKEKLLSVYQNLLKGD